MSRDMDGDGVVETVSFLGLIPIWSKSAGVSYTWDEPAGLYMAASAEYPDIFTASAIGQQWLTDEDVAAKFPEITYQAQNTETLARPTTTAQVFSTDEVHYLQVGYNALGIDIANNLFAWLNGEKNTPEISIFDGDTMTEIADSVELNYGEPMILSPVTEPITAGELTFTVSGSITLGYPLQVVATGNGEGTLTVSYHDSVLKQITFTCNNAPISTGN